MMRGRGKKGCLFRRPAPYPTLARKSAWLVLLIPGCNDPQPASPLDRTRVTESHPTQDRQAGGAPTALPRTEPERQSAAKLVETYFALIGARRYAEALHLRWDADRLSLERFAASFASYAEYRATVGAPSEVLRSEGWLYVSVPVHRYGTMKSGQPFGNVGTVLVSCRDAPAGSGPQRRRWRIHPSG